MFTLTLVLIAVGIWWLGLTFCCLGDWTQARLHRRDGWFARAEDAHHQECDADPEEPSDADGTTPYRQPSLPKLVLAYLIGGGLFLLFLPMIIIGVLRDCIDKRRKNGKTG